MANNDPWNSADTVADDRADLFKFEEAGDSIVGIPYKKLENQGSRGNSTIYSFYTEAEDEDDAYGLKNIWGSASLDRELPNLAGKIVKVEYHGKKDIGGGQSLNMFDIKSLDDTPENREKVNLSEDIPDVDEGVMESFTPKENQDSQPDEDITPDDEDIDF